MGGIASFPNLAGEVAGDFADSGWFARDVAGIVSLSNTRTREPNGARLDAVWVR